MNNRLPHHTPSEKEHEKVYRDHHMHWRRGGELYTTRAPVRIYVLVKNAMLAHGTAMRFFVHAKPKSKKEGIVALDEAHFVVSVKEAPEKGKANEAVIRMLADHLGIAPSRMRIVRGETGKRKIIEVA